MGKIEKNKQQKLDKLLDSSFELFLKNGIEKTSVSDITHAAGVAKGTFYLYFHDKYEIRDRLITQNASRLFLNASHALEEGSGPSNGHTTFEDQLIFIVNHILLQLARNKPLLTFISKNLSWGIFRHALTETSDESGINFQSVYRSLIENNPSVRFKDPEVMLFMIIELASSTSYSTILHGDPIHFDDLLPYLNMAIRDIIRRHRIESTSA